MMKRTFQNDLPNMRYMEWTPPPQQRCNPHQMVGTTQTDLGDDVDLPLKLPHDFIDQMVPKENVTVKFRVSETQVIAQVYSNRLTMMEIKEDIAYKFEVEPEVLVLRQCDREVHDDCLLAQTDSDQFGIYEFVLSVREPGAGDSAKAQRLDLNVYYAKFRLPDFITVHIPPEDANGVPKNIIVEIQNKAIVKPFLCGYKNKVTGIEYLDAFTQTGPYFDKWKYRRYISRDTQTYDIKENSINTAHDQASQCWQDGNNVRYVSAATDYHITPGKYQTHAQKVRSENKLAKIILIQRNWRRYLIVNYMKKAAAEYRRLVANRIADDEKFKKEQEMRIRREKRAKEFPRTKNDFDLLYSEVQKWKIAELKRIASMYEGPARIAEVNILLDKEIQLLNGIDRQRDLVFQAMQDFRNEQLLTKLGKPIQWVGYKGTIIHLDLIRTQRCRFLTEIYKDLQKPLEKQERIELLNKVKRILLNERDFPEFPELFDLIQREINLLLHTQYCDVNLLRKRQNMHFLELIKFSKDHNPEKVGKRLCIVCKEVKPYDHFALRTRQNRVDTCTKCAHLKKPPKDTTAYTAILRAIQRDERKRHCNASFAFVMQVDDIRHLVEQIWHGHSILSKNENINNLRLPRWVKSEDWSPWNCVCLTDSEARNHYRIEDLNQVYDNKLILSVYNRHKLARSAFHKMTAVATEFLESGQWFRVGMDHQRSVAKPSAYPPKEFSIERTRKLFASPTEEECRRN